MNARSFNHARKQLDRLQCIITELKLVSENLQHTPQLDVFTIRKCLRLVQQQTHRLNDAIYPEVA